MHISVFYVYKTCYYDFMFISDINTKYDNFFMKLRD